jgi:hypothetical protein
VKDSPQKRKREDSASRRQERFIVALLENPNVEKAAIAAGVSKTTLYRAMQKPEFEEAYRKARRAATSRCVARAQHSSSAAMGTLLRVMADPGTSASAKVRAADIVLQTAFRGTENEDIVARLEELERGAEEAKATSHRGYR